MTRTRMAVAAAATVLGAMAVAGCGSSSSSSDSSSSAAPSSSTASPSTSSGGSDTAKTSSIMIMGFKFTGATSVKPGQRIMVMNHDSEAHTVTADKGGAFDVKVPPGKTVMMTAPSKPGSYAYHCTYHADMHGMLKVS